ncbi:MAG TPA: hypothetical protein VNX21_05965 [Candidatus Thermoplasmatota archaeon]|nr:hypothetical protein [Candidatus Thermoplasmatota archaeon]
MTARRLALAALALLAAATLAPVASACIQVYPWSELCRGDVVGFVQGLLP